jgi:hypothetical protein
MEKREGGETRLQLSRVLGLIRHKVAFSLGNRFFAVRSRHLPSLDRPENPAGKVEDDGDREQDPKDDFDGDRSRGLPVRVRLPLVEPGCNLPVPNSDRDDTDDDVKKTDDRRERAMERRVS